MRRNIYLGPNSCYKLPYSYITSRSAAAILSKMREELRSGVTYDHSCRPIRMSDVGYRNFLELIKKRARYLIPLAIKHGSDVEAVRGLVHRFLASLEVPVVAEATRRRRRRVGLRV
ncbi:MAG: hypothetical protein ACK4SY_07040 [Pyrobaculum sp.]